MFAWKLKNYDRIEGYNAEDPSDAYYLRDIVTAYLLDDAGNETGETVQTYMYHRKEDVDESEPVPNGDWL